MHLGDALPGCHSIPQTLGVLDPFTRSMSSEGYIPFSLESEGQRQLSPCCNAGLELPKVLLRSSLVLLHAAAKSYL